jgi:thiamine biosynthesis lipoprotein
VLEGKTMGTFWRVSVIALRGESEKLRRKFRRSWMPTIAALHLENDSALMRFNHSPVGAVAGERSDG